MSQAALTSYPPLFNATGANKFVDSQFPSFGIPAREKVDFIHVHDLQEPKTAQASDLSPEAALHQEDVALVSRAQSGDAQAFDALVVKHTSKLYGLVYQMTSNHEDTNDLLQDIWAKIYRSLAGFRGASRFTTWMHSIAVNMTINFLKRRTRRQAVSLDAPDAEDGRTPAADALLVNPHTPRSEAYLGELQTRLTEALAKLSPGHRAVVTMFDIQGMAHAEISKILGVSEGTVRSRLFYAHRQLQGFLADMHHPTSNTSHT